MSAPVALDFHPIPGSPFDGEADGPAWDGEGWLVARPASSEIVRYLPATGESKRFRHSTSGNRGLALGPTGRLYGAQTTSRRVVWYAPDGSTYYLNAMLDDRRHNDPQDLVVDGLGRIWFSDDWTAESSAGPVGWPPLEHRSILRLRRVGETEDGIGEWALERMTTDTTAPRGVGLSPDERTLYVTDLGGAASAPALRAYPLAGSSLGAGRVLADFGPGAGALAGRPGGLAVARDGRLLVAIAGGPGGGRIAELEPEGTLRMLHPVPDGGPTNCAVGGPAGSSVLVTTVSGAVLEAELSDRARGTIGSGG
jgi:gluconolactonase